MKEKVVLHWKNELWLATIILEWLTPFPYAILLKNDIERCFSLEEQELISESPTFVKYAHGHESTGPQDILFLKLFLASKSGIHYSHPSLLPPLSSFLSACPNDEELNSVWESIHTNDYLKWWACGFLSKPVHLTPFNFTDQTFKFLDQSASSPEHDYAM